jgi:hypothetical protein
MGGEFKVNVRREAERSNTEDTEVGAQRAQRRETQEGGVNPPLHGGLRSGLVGGGFAGDEAGAAAEREVEKTPLDEDDDAALEFDDVDEVDEDPQAPGGEAGNVNAENVGDGGGAADDSHIALVEIFEGRESAAGEAGLDEFASVFSALDGDLGNAGERIAFCVVGDGQIAEDENLGMVGGGEVGIDFETARAIAFCVEAFGNFAGEGSGGDAAGPEDGAGGDGAGGFAVFVADAIGTNVGDEGAEHDFDAEVLDEFFGFGGKIFGIGSENARAAFHENDAGFLGTDAAKVVFQGVVSDFGEGAGEFEAGGTGADDDEGEPGAFFGFGFGALSAFEGVQKLVTHAGGFFDGFEAGGVFAPVVVAVVGGLGTGGDDEGVIGEGVAVGEKDFFGLGIDVDRFAEKNFNILLVAEDGADGRGNFGGRERTGSYLVEERLEEVEVAFVEEGDVHVGALEGLCGDEAREASAQD